MSEPAGDRPKVVPELDVSDLDASLGFYVAICGFEVAYARAEERFAYLDLGGAQLMLQEAAGPGRRFRTASLERPFGRGVNLQIEVGDLDSLYRRVDGAGVHTLWGPEERWYRRSSDTVGQRQFVVADPDGYLLRFFQPIGSIEEPARRPP